MEKNSQRKELLHQSNCIVTNNIIIILLKYIYKHKTNPPLIPAWWVGQRSRERWRCRRLCEGGRRFIWKARCSRGGALLQVRHIPSPRCMSASSVCPQYVLPRFPFPPCRQKEKEQMEMLRKHHAEEIEHHKKEIERLQREIDRHKGKIRKLKHDDWSWEACYHFSSWESGHLIAKSMMMIRY